MRNKFLLWKKKALLKTVSSQHLSISLFRRVETLDRHHYCRRFQDSIHNHLFTSKVVETIDSKGEGGFRAGDSRSRGKSSVTS